MSRAVNRFYCIGVLQLMLGVQLGTSGKIFVLGSRRGREGAESAEELQLALLLPICVVPAYCS